MMTIALMTHLDSSSEVFNDPDSLFFWYGMNFLIDGHFEFNNGLWIFLIHVVFQEPPEIENLGGSDRVNAETTRVCSAYWSAD